MKLRAFVCLAVLASATHALAEKQVASANARGTSSGGGDEMFPSVLQCESVSGNSDLILTKQQLLSPSPEDIVVFKSSDPTKKWIFPSQIQQMGESQISQEVLSSRKTKRRTSLSLTYLAFSEVADSFGGKPVVLSVDVYLDQSRTKKGVRTYPAVLSVNLDGEVFQEIPLQCKISAPALSSHFPVAK